MPVLEILTWAYDLRFDQFLALEASLTSWARTEGYDIEALANGQMTASQCQQLVQGLFVDRFGMKSHWKKTPNAPVYEFRVMPRGHKMQPVSATDAGCGVHISTDGREHPCDRYQWPLAPKRAMSMKELARELSMYTGERPIRDMTGLDGEYKINLSFTRRSDNFDYPSLEAALREQLGLEMRATRGDVDVLIVDRIDRPTAN